MLDYLAANLIAALVFLAIALVIYLCPIGRWIKDMIP